MYRHGCTTATTTQYIMLGSLGVPSRSVLGPGTVVPVARAASVPNSKVSLPVGRATYNIHFTKHKFWKAARKQIDKVITEKEGAREVGLLQDEKGSIVKGCEDKYKTLIEIVSSLVKKSSPSLTESHFTALSITKGWYWTESITDPEKTLAASRAT